MPSPARRHDQDEGAGADYGLGRLLTLSDGVFAIAITLLVLSLHVDAGVPVSQLDDLRDQVPELYAYALSVLVIGTFWMAHHRTYAYIVRVDNGLLFANLLYLGTVALIPFPTDLIGRYPDEISAVVMCGALIGVLALAAMGSTYYAERHELMHPALARHRGQCLPGASTAHRRGLPGQRPAGLRLDRPGQVLLGGGRAGPRAGWPSLQAKTVRRRARGRRAHVRPAFPSEADGGFLADGGGRP
jgi:uncharacterized membrane protein